MTVSELMQAMADAGAPFDAILIAVRALEAKDAEIAARDAEVAEKRAKDAERKRNARASTDNPRTVHGRGADAQNSSPIVYKPPVSPKGDTAPKGVRGSRREKTKPPAKPENVSEQTWADFVRHRHAKRAPVTETAMVGIKREAEKAGWPLERALVETITRGWQSFRADWIADKPSGGSGSFLSSLGSGP